MDETVREYTNGEVTVVWKPDLCIHATLCWKGLPEVFEPKKKPWVNINGASTERIIKQVEECPSGALSAYKNKDKTVKTDETKDDFVKIKVMKDGPLMVYGDLKIEGIDGSITNKEKCTAFCRCGVSKNKPYCDGTHKEINFSD